MTCAWSVPRNGSTGFTVTVTAWDAAGNTATQQISITESSFPARRLSHRG